MSEILRAPFPYFGGKSRAAHLIWPRLGDVGNYIEPFFGSGAVLLARPSEPGVETVNDMNCYLANFWRALTLAPEAVADFADWPVNEADLHARHLWLLSQTDFRERMKVDPDYYDPKIAGWWVWGQSTWIAGGWCDYEKLDSEGNIDVARPIPMVDPQGVNRKAILNHSAAQGISVHRKLPVAHSAGVHTGRSVPRSIDVGVNATRITTDSVSGGVQEYMIALARRMRRTRVICGDWSRIVQPSYLGNQLTGVVLDPPYFDGLSDGLYAHTDANVSARVREWAIENGSNPKLRIVLCGYEGEHALPDDWTVVEWRATGGFGCQRKDGTNQNQERERLWFSPHCLNVNDSLFAVFEEEGVE